MIVSNMWLHTDTRYFYAIIKSAILTCIQQNDCSITQKVHFINDCIDHSNKIITQILANPYLKKLDLELERRRHRLTN